MVLAGDHVYKMDYSLMLAQHVDPAPTSRSAASRCRRLEATGFGVMHVDEDGRIIQFLEKPKDPPAMPGKPDVALASMGIYVFQLQLPLRPACARRRRPELEP